MRRASRVHAVAQCDMCKRESYIRMIYCVPFGREHYAFCRECADGLLAPASRARIEATNGVGDLLPVSP